jgi:succinate dehydrogenase / fumarate reductase cytochrome b subunit
VDTATVYLAPNLYMDVIGVYRSTLFGLGEIALVFCVLFHGVNGLRIAFYDLFAPKQWLLPTQQKAVLYELVVTMLIWIPAAAIMFRNILVHNFGILGG